MLKLLILLFVLGAYVLALSMCRVSAIADRQLEQLMAEQEKEKDGK